MEKTERQQIAAMLGKKGGETTAKRYTSEQLSKWGKKGAIAKKKKKEHGDKTLDEASGGM